ncbi:MAG TPA: metallophosphoesterase [Verrucomicrobiae bacterium]|nr:metallophosphoesterase [Verrucomicrobiae bacterium]
MKYVQVRLLRTLALALACGLPGRVQSSGSGSGHSLPEGYNENFARAPYVQLATPTSIVIVWRTEGPIDPVVQFGRLPGKPEYAIGSTSIVTRVALTTNRTELAKLQAANAPELRLPRLHSAPVGLYQYEAHLIGLAPNTRYFYSIFDGKTRLAGGDPSCHFTTYPLKGQAKSVRFWVVGDSGTGRETQYNVHNSMTKFVARDHRPLDFYLHLGDMAYTRGRDPEFQSRFFEAYDATLRNTVCWPTMGNHEGGTSKGTNGVGPYYDAYVLPTRGEAGGLASGTEAYYSFDYGRVHLICLDSHDMDRKPTGIMARWLTMDLQRAKADWIIAYFHHPPYTQGSHNSDREPQLIQMRTHIMPILESYGVDLVLTGHSHIYERSMLMNGAYETPTVAEGFIFQDHEGDPRKDGPYRKSAGITPNNGTIQVVAGNGGTTLGRKGTMPVMRKIILQHGSCIIDINGDTLRGTMINKFAEVRDEFAVVKRGRVRQERLLNPWQPEAWRPPKSPSGEPAAEPPEDYIAAIPRSSEWDYVGGKDPGPKWTELNFVPEGWNRGQAPFGYSYPEVRTVLDDMKNSYQRVYLRHEFEIEQADYIAELGLMINYDDAFIAYLNGKEVLRKGVGKGAGKDAQQIKTHEANKHSYYPLKDFEKYLRNGRNVLAIEGHNKTLDSPDFLIDPYLLVED